MMDFILSIIFCEKMFDREHNVNTVMKRDLITIERFCVYIKYKVRMPI